MYIVYTLNTCIDTHVTAACLLFEGLAVVCSGAYFRLNHVPRLEHT